MKSILHFFSFFLSCFFSFHTHAQCLITTTETTHSWSSGIGPGSSPSTRNAQTIKVCEVGTVTSLAMSKMALVFGSTTGKLELYRSSTSFTNLVWTRDEFPITVPASITGLSWQTIDFTIGQGENYSLNADEGVTFQFHRGVDDIPYAFHFNNLNPYPDGMMVTGIFFPWNNGNNDWLMKVAMNGAALPVDYLRELWAKPEDGKMVLRWATANEINNLGFDIERSRDGISFENIGWVDGHGNEAGPINYKFTEDFPQTGRIYYRLKQQDYDGRFAYSHITHVDVKGSGDIQIYPNPATEYIQVKVEEGEAFQILNHLMKPEIIGKIPSSQDIMIGNLNPGIYFLRLEHKNETVRFVKL